MSDVQDPFQDIDQAAIGAEKSFANEQVTIISYHRPIATMLDHLFGSEGWDAHARIEDRDLAYALSAVLMLVVWLEAATGRVRVLHKGVKDKKNASKLLTELPSNSCHADQIFELFVIRDVIAHGHVHTIYYEPDGGGDLVGIDGGLWSICYGDQKYKNCVEMQNELPVTRRLRLNLATTHVSRRDVLVVLSEVLDCLERLHVAGDLDGNWGEHSCGFRGTVSSMSEVRTQLAGESKIV